MKQLNVTRMSTTSTVLNGSSLDGDVTLADCLLATFMIQEGKEGSKLDSESILATVFSFAQQSDDQDTFTAQMKQAESLHRNAGELTNLELTQFETDSKGKVKLPRTWVQIKSNLNGVFKQGLHPKNFATETESREAAKTIRQATKEKEQAEKLDEAVIAKNGQGMPELDSVYAALVSQLNSLDAEAKYNVGNKKPISVDAMIQDTFKQLAKQLERAKTAQAILPTAPKAPIDSEIADLIKDVA